jgi:hypothetical protein
MYAHSFAFYAVFDCYATEKSKKNEPRGYVAPNEFLPYRLVQFDHCGGHLLGSTQLDFCALYLVDIEYVQCFTPLVRAFGISQ